MATQATNVSINKTGLRDRFEGFLAGISVGFTAYMDRIARTRQIEYLNAKSDAELAKLGLKREDIPRYVFRDVFYF
ncbi:MAG: hypothetical protein R3256_06445 [Thalassovita sp.]|nr:hypothetical protein [Thalassovita sp.]